MGPGSHCVDATAGNGHDTLFLARLVGPDGRVLAVDVQEAACSATRRLLSENASDLGQVTVLCGGHENLRKWAPADWPGQVSAVMFNLGYLPGSDRSCLTRPETTLAALSESCEMLRPGGILTVVCYPGHPGGEEEADAVREFFTRLDAAAWTAVEYRVLNSRASSPFLLACIRK